MLEHKHKDVTGKVVKAGILGIVIGAVATFFLAAKSGKQNREDVKDWVRDMQDEVSARAKEAHGLTKEKYDEIVDQVAQKRKAVQNIKEEEWDDLVSDMKKHWDKIKDIWQE
jgi:gas vesicle protein